MFSGNIFSIVKINNVIISASAGLTYMAEVAHATGPAL